MEREALAPHPRWRHFAARVSQPRILALLALAALAIGVAGLFASGKLLPGNEPGNVSPKPGAIVPGDINVAVLNGTSIPGLAGRVGDDVQRSGFQLGSVTNSRKQYQQTVVMFGQGQQKAATRVAHVLGVTPVQPIDAQTRSLAPNANVVVIAGVDRVKLVVGFHRKRWPQIAATHVPVARIASLFGLPRLAWRRLDLAVSGTTS